MLTSILDSTKKILGIDFSYTAFDTDIITHINSVFATLNQIGIGPPNGFFIDGSDEKWADLQLNDVQLNWTRSYLYLKVRMLFRPPTTSYLIEAMERQISEFEHRLHTAREVDIQQLLADQEPEEEESWELMG